jgi:predicted nucleic-acid-binding Zn-ribbon protein
MKKTLHCPKCEGRKLWRVEEMRERGRNMTKAEPLGATFAPTWHGVTNRGTFETFICAGCGYTEWYAHGLEQLEADASKGVYFIDDQPESRLR